MIAFRTATFQQTIDIEKLNQKMAGVPTTIVEGLLTRFSESARESKTSQPTNATRTNLLTHLFALCLRIDNYATDTTLLSSDLSIDLQKTNLLFKSLGCKMEFLKEKELKRLGLADAAANTKRAILRVPLEFPKTKMQKKVKRRGE
jgi:DNA-directed RNA polymerase I subunit RPA49